jgi:hypothetical protein
MRTDIRVADSDGHLLGEREEAWNQWQRDVLCVIRADFHSVLQEVSEEDIDWAAWRPLFEQGCSARAAVHSSFGQVA